MTTDGTKVWVVQALYDYEPGTLIGVFSTKRLARKHVDDMDTEDLIASIHVSEWTLDKPEQWP